MVDKNEILIRFYRRGESKSKISRCLGISRKTIRKYINEHEKIRSSTQLGKHIEKGLTCVPKYKTANRQKIKLTREIQSQIDIYLKQNLEKRHQGLHKQIMKKADVHEALIEKGYQIGYTTVCNYVRGKTSYGKEAFIKQVYQPGVVCEFDWGEVKLYINGDLKTLNLAVFTCCYSNYRYSKLFHRQDTLAFSQSHVDFFTQLNGVHKELVYDNMRVAVKRFVGPSEKEATRGLLELSSYYHFGFRFCNVRKGNEKGHVERSVEYIRRKSFCRNSSFSSIDEANNHLLETCLKLNKSPQVLSNSKTANELLEEEKKFLYRPISPYKCFEQENAKVDKYSTVIYQGNRYSVPDHLVGQLLELRVFAEKITVYQKSVEICEHSRSYGAHTWTLDLGHYLGTLLRKPGALTGSLALQQTDVEIRVIYNNYFTKDSRGFIELLQYCQNKDINFNLLKKAIETVKKITPRDISKDKILAVIGCEKEPKQQEKKDDEITTHSNELLEELSELIT